MKDDKWTGKLTILVRVHLHWNCAMIPVNVNAAHEGQEGDACEIISFHNTRVALWDTEVVRWLTAHNINKLIIIKRL